MVNSINQDFLNIKRELFNKLYDNLNCEQREAVLTVNGPLLVLAGAGTGKTTVLVNRIAHIIRYGNAYDSNNVPNNLTEEKISLSAESTKTYVTDLLEEEYVTKATFEVRYDGIYSQVVDLQDTADGLSNSVSSISQTANEISSQVSKMDNGEFQEKTLFVQDSGKFYFDGNQTIFTGCIWFTNNSKQKRFSISHDESNIYTPAIYLYNTDDNEPIVIGKTDDCVYLANENSDNNLIATRGWVLENAGASGDIKIVAVFG